MGLVDGIKAFLEGLLLRPIDNRPIGLGPIHDMPDEVLLNQLARPAIAKAQFSIPKQSPYGNLYQFSTLPAPVPKAVKPAKSPKDSSVAPAFNRIPSADYTFRPVPPRFNPWTHKSY